MLPPVLSSPGAARDLARVFSHLPPHLVPNPKDAPALQVLVHNLSRDQPPVVELGDGFVPPRLIPWGSDRSDPRRHPFGLSELNAVPPQFDTGRGYWGTLFLLATAGTLATLLTNVAATPLDFLKTLQQTAHHEEGLWHTACQQVQTFGLGSLFTGSLAVAMMCVMYGSVLYPGMELGRDLVTSRVGEAAAVRWRPFILFGIAAVCTFISVATSLPWEVVKIRLQADPPGAAASANCFEVLLRMVREEGLAPCYRSYFPVIGRSLLYNAGKFFVFDYFPDVVGALLPAAALATVRWLLPLAKGLIAGCAAVVLSQPMDVVVTRITQSPAPLTFWHAVADLHAAGGLGIFYAGLLARALWASVTIGLQFFVYDVAKAALSRALLLGVP
jgi:hypothetical protein